MSKITLLVPRVPPPEDATPAVEFSSRPESVEGLRGLRIGFLDNTKPNSDKYLRLLADTLRERFGLGAAIHRRKHDSSSPAAETLLLGLVDECDMVVNAVPD